MMSREQCMVSNKQRAMHNVTIFIGHLDLIQGKSQSSWHSKICEYMHHKQDEILLEKAQGSQWLTTAINPIIYMERNYSN